MTAFDHALESVLTLSHDEQDALLETVRKRRIEERRREIIANAHEAVALDEAGLLPSETAEELIHRLRASLEMVDAENT